MQLTGKLITGVFVCGLLAMGAPLSPEVFAQNGETQQQQQPMNIMEDPPAAPEARQVQPNTITAPGEASGMNTVPDETPDETAAVPPDEEIEGNNTTADNDTPTPQDIRDSLPAQASVEAYNPLMVQEETRPVDIPSLFFTRDSLALIRDAQSGLNTLASENSGGGEGRNVEKGIRELSLGGLVYRGKKDWTLWLNSRRVTPETIPEQVFDLDVYPKYIDVKWYDRYTNRLYPIRLRPHERFNLDARLFLSGPSAEDQQLY